LGIGGSLVDCEFGTLDEQIIADVGPILTAGFNEILRDISMVENRLDPKSFHRQVVVPRRPVLHGVRLEHEPRV
jgi:hypothetical protein